MLLDRDIREALCRRLNADHAQDADALIVPELGLCQGDARIDLAVVNAALHGYEIKSDADTLARLPAQAMIYSRTLSTVTLIVGRKHFDAAIELVPAWWTIEEPRLLDGMVVFETLRPGQPNPSVDVRAVCELLWRKEALALVREYRLKAYLAGNRREHFWDALAAHVPADELTARIREQIKSRGDWREHFRRRSGAG